MTNLPKWVEKYKASATDNEDQLVEALSIAWEALEAIRLRTYCHGGPRPPKKLIHGYAQDALRRIEELGK